MKLCECGCGQLTNVSSFNRPNRGVKKGEHFRYVAGHHPHAFPKGHKINIGKIQTVEHKQRIGVGVLRAAKEGKLMGFPKGTTAWNKGMSKENGDLLVYGKPRSDETKDKMSKAAILRWENLKYRESQTKAVLKISIPNKKEIWLGELLEKLYPGEWKFVGDGQVIIAGKCPDFINVNGQKKIIEFWGDRWHEDENPEKRKEVFKPYGYETLVIWGHELKNMDKMKLTIKNFCESK